MGREAVVDELMQVVLLGRLVRVAVKMAMLGMRKKSVRIPRNREGKDTSAASSAATCTPEGTPESGA